MKCNATGCDNNAEHIASILFGNILPKPLETSLAIKRGDEWFMDVAVCSSHTGCWFTEERCGLDFHGIYGPTRAYRAPVWTLMIEREYET